MTSTTAGGVWSDEDEFVGPGVHRIPVVLPGDGLRAVNVYVLSDATGVDLVDCGVSTAASEDALVAGLTRLGVGLDDVRNVFVTHHHVDHYSLARKLRREHRFTLHLGEGERANLRAIRQVIASGTERSFVADMRRIGLPSADGALATPEAPTTDPEVWADPDHWVGDGATLPSRSRDLTAIATPGHTRGHLVFRDAEDGLLLAGDHVLSRTWTPQPRGGRP